MFAGHDPKPLALVMLYGQIPVVVYTGLLIKYGLLVIPESTTGVVPSVYVHEKGGVPVNVNLNCPIEALLIQIESEPEITTLIEGSLTMASFTVSLEQPVTPVSMSCKVSIPGVAEKVIEILSGLPKTELIVPNVADPLIDQLYVDPGVGFTS
jgi:hypothetical protein